MKTKTRHARKKSLREKLDAQLAQLASAQLIRLDAEGELTYTFKHVFTQEAAYGSLLHQQRRQIHRSVAETYERIYPDCLDENAELLAAHYAQAGDDAKTLEYSMRSGDKAARTYAHAESITHYGRALEVALRTVGTGETLARIFVQRGRAFELAGDYAGALANYEEMESQARVRGDRSLELQARLHRATVYVVGGPVTDFGRAHAIATEALAQARELGDKPAEARADWNLLLANRFGNEGLARAIGYGEQSAAIARELGLREQLALALHDLSLAYHGTRQYERGVAALQEVIRLWRDLDNQPLLANAITALGGVYYAWGDLETARRYAQEAYALDHSIGNAYGLVSDAGLLAGIHAELGELERFCEFFAEIERNERQAGAMLISAILRVERALVLSEVGAWEDAQTIAQQALAFFNGAMPSQSPGAVAVLASLRLALGDLDAVEKMMADIPRASFDEYAQWYWPGSSREAVLTLLAELALAKGETAEAERTADELVNGLERTQTRLRLPAALYLKAKVLRVQNRLDQARTVLDQARAKAEAMGMRRCLPEIFIALSEVEAQLGHAVEAQAASAQARQVIEYVAAHAPHELREAFLARRDVRGIMETS